MYTLIGTWSYLSNGHLPPELARISSTIEPVLFTATITLFPVRILFTFYPLLMSTNSFNLISPISIFYPTIAIDPILVVLHLKKSCLQHSNTFPVYILVYDHVSHNNHQLSHLTTNVYRKPKYNWLLLMVLQQHTIGNKCDTNITCFDAT